MLEFDWNVVLSTSGHVRAKWMVSLDPRPMTSYSTFIVTLSLAATVSELQPYEICLNSIGPRFRHFRSREGQANGVTRPANHDFLFNFNSNHEAKYHRLEDTAF